MQTPDDNDRFIGVGDTFEPDPNQTAIPMPGENVEATPADLTEYLDNNFEKTSGPHGGQWRGPCIWVEYGAGTIVIWNAQNMRYTHKKFGSAEAGYIQKALEWIKENKDVPQEVPEDVRKSGEALAEMWDQSKRNPENQQ